MKNIQIDDTVYRLAERWDELTFGQMLKISRSDGKDVLHTIAIMMDTDYDTVFALNPDDVEEHILPLIAFLSIEMDFDNIKTPKELLIYNSDGEPVKNIKVPRDIQLGTFGQKVAFQHIMYGKEDLIERFAELVSIYLYPVFAEGKYDEQGVKDFAEQHVMYCRAMDIYALGSFFLNRWMRYLEKKVNYSVRTMSRKNYRLVSKSLNALVP